MSTSLQEQLRRLAVPQTKTLIDTRRRASILFDAKEAATKNRRAIFEIGVSGLQELVLLNPLFQQFEFTLFDENTIDLERAVEKSDVNELLDKNVAKFFQHLSPYFLLRPAHMCLEWLLRRFHIHEFNRKELIALALPYHETNICVRVLQTMHFRESDAEWAWLRPLQKAGVPVPKTAILNRAASHAAFFKFICNSTLAAVQELGPHAGLLQSQLNFYVSVAVGALENASEVQEWHVTTILPSLLKGLSSKIIDFASAAYIVSAQLVARTQLTSKLCNAFIERVANVSFERLRPTAVLLLIWILDTQAEAQHRLSPAALLTLVKHKWLTRMLASLAKNNVAVEALCGPLLQGSVAAIQNGHEEVETFKIFLNSLLSEVELPTAAAQQFINTFLSSFVASTALENPSNLTDGEIIELDSDEDMPNVEKEFQMWYSNYLHQLERKYPTAFDLTVKEALKTTSRKSTTNRSKALKMALSFRLKSFDDNATAIYESLYHRTAKIRVHAIQTLLENLGDYQAHPQYYQLLKESLADRIKDDSDLVVAEILKLPTKDFIDILGYSEFMKALFSILHKTQVDADRWMKVTPLVVQHITSHEVVEHFDTNLILVALMPILFPAENNDAIKEGIGQILHSPLTDKLKFLKQLKISKGKKGGDFNVAQFREQFLEVISSANDTPSVQDFLNSVESQGSEFFTRSMHLTHFLLLVTACFKETFEAEEGLKIFERIRLYCSHFKIKHLEAKSWAAVKELDVVPLQLFSDFLTTLIQHTSFNDLCDWGQTGANLKLFLQIFDMLANEAFSQTIMQVKNEWSKLLKELFDRVFKSAQEKIEFLTNFYVYTDLNEVMSFNYTVLRLRAFKIFHSLLKNQANDYKITTEHILKITIALNSHSEVMRLQCLETLKVIKDSDRLESNNKHFINGILERQLEISMDHEQFPLVLYTILKPAQKKHKHFSAPKMLREILSCLTPEGGNDNAIFSREILKALKHVNDEAILSQLIPLAANALERGVTHEGPLRTVNEPYSSIFQLVCERFDSQNIENILLDNPGAWELIEKIFRHYDLFMCVEKNMQPMPCVLLECFDEYIYEKMTEKLRVQLIKLIINSVALAENDTIFLTANKLLKKCSMNCQLLMPVLESMFKRIDEKKSPRRKSSSKLEPAKNKQDRVNSLEWKEGVVLLELLENKKKLTNCEKIIPVLFELLKFCLEVEEQIAVEYTKQLTLSALHHCCQLAEAQSIDLQKALPKSTFRIDLIVQCVRATQNPQTQNNALMLLSHCAGLFPQQVLHNVVDIFTFMGSSVVRHDDAFSFHIINNIMDSIIPIVIRGDKTAARSNEDVNTFVIPVLKVFSDILMDVPEHRRPPLYAKLLQTLGVGQYLWIFLCVVFEAHVVEDEKQRLLQKKSPATSANKSPSSSPADKTAKRIEISIELINSFEPRIMIETFIYLLDYIKSLPLKRDSNPEGETASIPLKRKPSLMAGVEATEISLFDVKTRTAKQLRHYKYIIMQFLSTVSGSPEFLNRIATLSEAEQLEMKPFYQNFIIKTLSYAPLVNSAIEKSDDTTQTKFWKVILHHVHDVLDNAISLLSPDMFLIVINGLMQHQLLSIRKKVIELLISKLQQRDSFFDATNKQNFQNLLKPLSEIVGSILPKNEMADGKVCSSSNELAYLQQTALIAIKLLSKMFALVYLEDFKRLLADLVKIMKKRSSIPKIVLATVCLTMIEIACNLKVHSLAQLPKYMPQIIELLQDQTEFVRHQAPDNICVAIVTGVHKLFESLPLFLGPYVVDIITSLSLIAARISAQPIEKDQRSATILHKISTIWTKIATQVPVRILVPSCEKAYNKLMASKNYADVAILIKIFPEAISHAAVFDLSTVQLELSNFFLQLLEFRLKASQDKCDESLIASTEANTIEAFVAWVLKLSENDFRPLYRRVYEWAFVLAGHKETKLTYFMLSNKIAEVLKSLFVLFASDFIDDAAKLLDKCNCAKQEIDADEETINGALIKSILNTLNSLFLHDSKGYINTQRFELLMQPIIDQMENRLVLENETLQNALTECIVQLAITVSNDIHWKQLNYQVLLKTRNSVPEVRMLSFNCCVAIARKLGESFTPLLPETVPFIAELFEDENQRVEKNTRKGVQELEVILGESLQKYL